MKWTIHKIQQKRMIFYDLLNALKAAHMQMLQQSMQILQTPWQMRFFHVQKQRSKQVNKLTAQCIEHGRFQNQNRSNSFFLSKIACEQSRFTLFFFSESVCLMWSVFECIAKLQEIFFLDLSIFDLPAIHGQQKIKVHLSVEYTSRSHLLIKVSIWQPVKPCLFTGLKSKHW